MRTFTDMLTETHYNQIEQNFIAAQDALERKQQKSESLKATASTSTKEPRVSHEELQYSYMTDPSVFNGVNKIIQTIMSADSKVVATDPRTQRFYDYFIENLGNTYKRTTWRRLQRRILSNMIVHGWSFIEQVYGLKTRKIKDWVNLNPVRMDYAKDANGDVAVDGFGNPLGFVQKIPNALYGQKKQIDAVPNTVNLDANTIFLTPSRIALITMYDIGDGYYPIGLVEPCYKNSLRKLNVEEALANAIYRHGFPIIWAMIGDMNHEPTPQQITNILEKLKDVNFKGEIATPYYYKIQMLESKKADKLRQHLEYFQDSEAAGMGVPKPYATSSGESTNRATLNMLSALFELSLRDLIELFCDDMRRQLFAPLSKCYGLPEVPKLIWETAGIDETQKKIDRIIALVKAQLLENNQGLRNYIKKLERLEFEMGTEDEPGAGVKGFSQ